MESQSGNALLGLEQKPAPTPVSTTDSSSVSGMQQQHFQDLSQFVRQLTFNTTILPQDSKHHTSYISSQLELNANMPALDRAGTEGEEEQQCSSGGCKKKYMYNFSPRGYHYIEVGALCNRFSNVQMPWHCAA